MQKKPHQAGFTLVELLIGIAISSMIFVAASSLVLILFQFNARARNTNFFEQTKTQLHQEFFKTIRWAKVITITADSLTADGVSYALTDGKLTRNTAVLTPQAVTVTKFSVYDASVTPAAKSIHITIEMENAKNPTLKDVSEFVISQRVSEITTESL